MARMTFRNRPAPTADILTCGSHTEARELATHLAEHAVPARLVRRPDGWLLTVEASDGELAAGLCGVDGPPRLPARPRRGGLVAGLLMATAGFGLGVVLTAAAPSAAAAPFAAQNARVAQTDDDGDGLVDRFVVFGDDGQPTAVWHDQDHDGAFDRIVRVHPEAGEAVELVDRDGDGMPDEVLVHDERGTHPGVLVAPRASTAP